MFDCDRFITASETSLTKVLVRVSGRLCEFARDSIVIRTREVGEKIKSQANIPILLETRRCLFWRMKGTNFFYPCWPRKEDGDPATRATTQINKIGWADIGG